MMKMQRSLNSELGTLNSELRIVTVDQIDRSKLNGFLSKVYRKLKSEFLRSYGTWWHRGDQNRWVILLDGEVAAYWGIIPAKCLINGVEKSAFWWVDLIIDPKFRGRGLQALIDREIRARSEIKLGFPNKLAARIHQKHGWGVREDLQVSMLPLRPLDVKNVRGATGLRGFLLHSAAFASTPLASLMRKRLMRYTSLTSQVLEKPSAEILEAIFLEYKRDDTTTTYRDAKYIQWRYLDASYRSDLVFYIAGPLSSPTHFLVSRHVGFQGVKATRILDVLGNFDDLEGLKDILKLAIKDAISQGSSQVTIMVTLPELQSVLRSIGFIIGAKVRFCWYSTSQAVMRSLGERCYWTLADSDNDAPE
jgi:GNAT superfamily N-acetyltransferase